MQLNSLQNQRILLEYLAFWGIEIALYWTTVRFHAQFALFFRWGEAQLSKLWAALFLRLLSTSFVFMGFLMPSPALSQQGSAARCPEHLKIFNGDEDPTRTDEVQTDDIHPATDMRVSQEVIDSNTVVDGLPPVDIVDPVRVDQVIADQRVPMPDAAIESPALRVESSPNGQAAKPHAIEPETTRLKPTEVTPTPRVAEPKPVEEESPPAIKPKPAESTKSTADPLSVWVVAEVDSQARVEVPKVGGILAQAINHAAEVLPTPSRGITDLRYGIESEYFETRQKDFEALLDEKGLPKGATLAQLGHEYSAGVAPTLTPTTRQIEKIREMAKHAVDRGEHFQLSGENIVLTLDGNDVYLIDRPNQRVSYGKGPFQLRKGQTVLSSNRERLNEGLDRGQIPTTRYDEDNAGFYIPGVVTGRRQGDDFFIFRFKQAPREGDLHSVVNLLFNLNRYPELRGREIR